MIICADDFGMSEPIDSAVLELVDRGKLSAVSCAVSHPACGRDAVEALMGRAGEADVGLHLVLTDEGRPEVASTRGSLRAREGFWKFGPLLRRSWLRRLDQHEIKTEIAAQYDRFSALAGQRPDFIDGHLHVHQFPVIREALLDFICELPPLERPYVRNTRMSARQMICAGSSLPKNLVIARPGSVFRRMAVQRGLATNTGFAGIYNYVTTADFSKLFGTFVSGVPSLNGMLVVHPGKDGWRRCEYDALSAWEPGPLTPNRFCWKRK